MGARTGSSEFYFLNNLRFASGQLNNTMLFFSYQNKKYAKYLLFHSIKNCWGMQEKERAAEALKWFV